MPPAPVMERALRCLVFICAFRVWRLGQLCRVPANCGWRTRWPQLESFATAGGRFSPTVHCSGCNAGPSLEGRWCAGAGSRWERHPMASDLRIPTRASGLLRIFWIGCKKRPDLLGGVVPLLGPPTPSNHCYWYSTGTCSGFAPQDERASEVVVMVFMFVSGVALSIAVTAACLSCKSLLQERCCSEHTGRYAPLTGGHARQIDVDPPRLEMPRGKGYQGRVQPEWARQSSSPSA